MPIKLICRGATRCGLAILALAPCSTLIHGQSIPNSEIRHRRERVMEELADGLLVLQARPAAKEMEQPAWIQHASFLYFTGLSHLPEAYLVLDGPQKESHLFIPPPPMSFGQPVEGLFAELRPSSATHLGFSSIQPWEQFLPYLEHRMQDSALRIYVDAARRPEPRGTPVTLPPLSGANNLWTHWLETRFSAARVVSAVESIRRLRWVKSPAEVRILRKNAGISGYALLTGLSRIRPGVSQRSVEASVVGACIEGGGEGPSFWPWLMSGPNALSTRLVRAFYDYSHLNRTMRVGELVRVDIGCMNEFYGGDVGRTVPVSGFFSAQQRRVWDLLVAGYLAGVRAMKPGITRKEIEGAARQGILATADSDAKIRIAEAMISTPGGVNWHLHGVGIESGEEALDTLFAGTVLAFEPMFVWEDEAYYLEDMIAITAEGQEILSRGLPYTADEIERFMGAQH